MLLLLDLLSLITDVDSVVNGRVNEGTVENKHMDINLGIWIQISVKFYLNFCIYSYLLKNYIDKNVVCLHLLFFDIESFFIAILKVS